MTSEELFEAATQLAKYRWEATGFEKGHPWKVSWEDVHPLVSTPQIITALGDLAEIVEAGFEVSYEGDNNEE